MNPFNREQKARIAVIDDDDSFRPALLRLLCASGFDPVGYSSAEEFLKDTNRVSIQCLVLDIYLGGMSGFELQKKLSAGGFTTPIIFVSGHEEIDIASLKKQTGCLEFFSKPVHPKLLLDAIRVVVMQNLESD
jgi:FixJ family two-component response regulator